MAGSETAGTFVPGTECEGGEEAHARDRKCQLRPDGGLASERSRNQINEVLRIWQLPLLKRDPLWSLNFHFWRACLGPLCGIDFVYFKLHYFLGQVI